MVLLISFSGSLAFRLSIPVVAYHVREELAASAFIVGLTTTAYFIMRAFSASISGEVIARLRDYRRLSLVGFLVSALVVLAYTYSYNWIIVIVLRLMQGFLAGLMWIPLQYAVSVYSRESWRGRAYAFYFLVGAIGAQIANVVYALMEAYGALAILALSSVLYLVSAALVYSIPLPKTTITKPNRSTAKTKEGMELRRFLPVFLAGFMVSFTLSIYYGDIPYVYVRETLGLTRQDTALVLAVTGFIGLGLSLIASHIADRYPDKPLLEFVVALVPLALLLICFGRLWLVIIGFSLLTVVSRVFTPLSRRVVTVSSSNPGRAVGYLNASSNIGMAIGFAYVGYMYDVLGIKMNIAGYDVLALPIALLPISIVSLILTFYLTSKYRTR